MTELIIAALILLVGIPVAFACYIGVSFIKETLKARRLLPPKRRR